MRDERDSGGGVIIQNQQTKFDMKLKYSGKLGFYIKTGDMVITYEMYSDFYRELDAMRLALVEAKLALSKQ